ncbi:MAG: hypothetical protein B7733_20005 [Myxococcales bacterium FL481]|nr:MAG: hypothetical protein B7733_20005 [Myxococcales bacterium FL481]
MKAFRIALTGGPGGGKTTAADLVRRELGECIVVVPEAATMLFSGGFPRNGDPFARKPVQTAIYHVQQNLEDIQAAHYPRRVLLCDRGTPDGAAYWPESDGPDFFSAMRTTLQDELDRYDAVLFFETAAVGGISIEGGNPARIESLADAVALDARLRALWSQHPHCRLIRHRASFLHKMQDAVREIRTVLDNHGVKPSTS